LLSAVPAVRDLAMTSNGVLLAGQAAALREAGLHRVTVSLDTLRPERFRALTRRDDHAAVLRGIEAVRAAGFPDLKLDTVVIRGVNEDELIDLVEWAASLLEGAARDETSWAKIISSLRFELMNVVPGLGEYLSDEDLRLSISVFLPKGHRPGGQQALPKWQQLALLIRKGRLVPVCSLKGPPFLQGHGTTSLTGAEVTRQATGK
jgi:hypothetical protein